MAIIDVSALVYTGTTSAWHKDDASYGFPVGGIRYLMRQLVTELKAHNDVVLCFDSPSFRSEIEPNYKAGRKRYPEVFAQLEFLYEMLPGCGIACEKERRYEADDLIAWTVEEAARKHYTEIVIIGNDRDLCHSVRGNIRFKSINPSAPYIWQGNFEEIADKTWTMFNTISAKKVFLGCSSDGIQPLKTSADPQELYDVYCQVLKKTGNEYNYEVTSSPEMLKKFGEMVEFTDAEMQALTQQIELVFPAENDGFSYAGANLGSVDEYAFAKFLTMIGDWDSLKCLGYKKARLTDGDKQMLYDRVRSLKSGEFAADNNLENTPLVAAKTLDLDVFTKEF